MALRTSHQFVYDCENCNGVASFDDGRQVWKHQDRKSVCVDLSVVAVALTQIALIAATVDNVSLVA